MQSLQKRCPQVVRIGSLKQLRQMGHSNRGSSRPVPGPAFWSLRMTWIYEIYVKIYIFTRRYVLTEEAIEVVAVESRSELANILL